MPLGIYEIKLTAYIGQSYTRLVGIIDLTDMLTFGIPYLTIDSLVDGMDIDIDFGLIDISTSPMFECVFDNRQ